MLQEGGQSQWLWPQEDSGLWKNHVQELVAVFCGRGFDQHRLCGNIREAAEER